MRLARAGDWWRRVYEKQYPVRLDRLHYEDVIGLGSGEIAFRGAITAICGENGVGKSTLLTAINKAVSDAESDQQGGARFGNASLRAHVTVNATEAQIHTVFSPYTRTNPEGVSVPIKYLAPAAESKDVLDFLRSLTNFDEMLEAYSPKTLEGRDLQARAYVVGRDYDACEIFEIEDYQDRPVFPYFRVRIGSLAYGSEMMGLGELALHLTLWQLERMPDRAIVLLEEPESHIAPRSQVALMDAIAHQSVTRNLWVVLSTHSAPMLGQIPREHVRLLYRSGSAADIIVSPSPAQLDQVLGIPVRHSAILLAEDSVGKAFAQAWLSIAAPEVLQQVQIHVGGSVGEIDSAVRGFPRVNAGFRLIGLYDGDQRQAEPDRTKPCAFLPGEHAPERILKAISADVDAVSVRTGRTAGEIRFALSQIEGLDDHDWLVEFSRRLVIPLTDLIRILLLIWLETESGASAGAEALPRLQAALEVKLTEIDG